MLVKKKYPVFFKNLLMSRKVISIIKCLVNYFLGYYFKLQAPDVCIDPGGEFNIYESLLVGRLTLLRSLRYLHDFPHIPIYVSYPFLSSILFSLKRMHPCINISCKYCIERNEQGASTNKNLGNLGCYLDIRFVFQ